MSSMKRTREEDREVESLAMANCLMLLSSVGSAAAASTCGGGGRVFTCKTCHRKFSSFQALGGHRASHKKPRLIGGSGDDLRIESPAAKPKTHECSICGVEFSVGQALGGHMRRHRLNNNSLSNHSSDNSSSDDGKSVEEAVPVLKKSNSSGSGKRVMLCLDLNLTPIENDINMINKLSTFSSFSSWLIA